MLLQLGSAEVAALGIGPLLGALSIVRFRPPVKEPEETGFIPLVIATSPSTVTFNLTFPGLVLAVSVAGLLILRSPMPVLSTRLDDGILMVTLPADSAHVETLIAAIREQLPHGTLDSISESVAEICNREYNVRQRCSPPSHLSLRS